MGVAETTPEDKLYLLWTSADKDVAMRMAFMYTFNAKAKGWWREVEVIVWGPSARLLAGDAELQNRVGELLQVGVEVVACRACADSYGVSDALAKLGIEVKYMGEPLTELLQAGYRLLSV